MLISLRLCVSAGLGFCNCSVTELVLGGPGGRRVAAGGRLAAGAGAEEPQEDEDDDYGGEDGFQAWQEPEDEGEYQQAFGAEEGPGGRACPGGEAGPECSKDDANAQACRGPYNIGFGKDQTSNAGSQQSDRGNTCSLPSFSIFGVLSIHSGRGLSSRVNSGDGVFGHQDVVGSDPDFLQFPSEVSFSRGSRSFSPQYTDSNSIGIPGTLQCQIGDAIDGGGPKDGRWCLGDLNQEFPFIDQDREDISGDRSAFFGGELIE